MLWQRAGWRAKWVLDGRKMAEHAGALRLRSSLSPEVHRRLSFQLLNLPVKKGSWARVACQERFECCLSRKVRCLPKFTGDFPIAKLACQERFVSYQHNREKILRTFLCWEHWFAPCAWRYCAATDVAVLARAALSMISLISRRPNKEDNIHGRAWLYCIATYLYLAGLVSFTLTILSSCFASKWPITTLAWCIIEVRINNIISINCIISTDHGPINSGLRGTFKNVQYPAFARPVSFGWALRPARPCCRAGPAQCFSGWSTDSCCCHCHPALRALAAALVTLMISLTNIFCELYNVIKEMYNIWTDCTTNCQVVQYMTKYCTTMYNKWQ